MVSTCQLAETARKTHHTASNAAAAFEVATLLDTGLSKEATKTVMELCEAGVNPEALAAVIKELRDEAARIQPGSMQAQ